MPIYSTNRVSGASTRIVAAEGYTDHDFGRIMCETYANDMLVFQHGLARDFKEAAAINENTMVKSELRAFQEFSLKEAKKSIVEKLKKLWSKIKAVFRNVYAKLSVWINRSNKLYVAQNRKALETKKNLGKCKLPKYRNVKKDVVAEINQDIQKLGGFANNAASYMKVGSMMNNTDFTKKIADLYNKNSDYVGDKEKEMFDKPNANLTFASCDLKGSLKTLFDTLTNSSKSLKDMKEANKKVDNVFGDLIKTVNSYADNKDLDEGKRDGYSKFSSTISEFQTAVQGMSRAVIKLTKKKLSGYRGIMAALVAFDPEAPLNDSAMLTEFAYLSGINMLTEETEDMTDEDIADAAEGDDGEVSINIEIDGTADADVNVEDNTGDDDE